ncbi:hypothetical protein ECG_07935 [Echinococcus granulosus]|nr:hypothetical protein ECG_07935 [Echinococcus granulosus]
MELNTGTMCNSVGFNQEGLKCTMFELKQCVYAIIQLLRSELNTCPVGEGLINKVHNLKSQLSELSEDLVRQCKCLRNSAQSCGTGLGIKLNVDRNDVLGRNRKCTKQEPCEFSFSPTSMTDFNPRELECQKPQVFGCDNLQISKEATNLCGNSMKPKTQTECPFHDDSDKAFEAEMFDQFCALGSAMSFENQTKEFENDVERVLILLNELKNILANGNCSGNRSFGPQALELVKCLENLVNGDSLANENDYLTQNFSAGILSEDFDIMRPDAIKPDIDLNTRFKDMMCKLYSELELLEDEVKERVISNLEKMRETLMNDEPMKGETEDMPCDEDANEAQHEGGSNSAPMECEDGTRENEQTGENALLNGNMDPEFQVETDPPDKEIHDTAKQSLTEDNEGNENNLSGHLLNVFPKKEEAVLSDASNNSVTESQSNFSLTADIREKITSLLCKRDRLTLLEFKGKLLSVLHDLDDILDTFETKLTTSKQLPLFDQQDRQNPIKPTASLFWVMSCLKNFIRRVEPNLQVPECNLEAKICSLLCVFSYLLQLHHPDSSNLGMAKEVLKCLDIELSRQGAGTSVLAAYTRQLEEMVMNAKAVKTDTKVEENAETGSINSFEFENTNHIHQIRPAVAEGAENTQSAPLNADTNNDPDGISQTASPLADEVECKEAANS